MAPYVDSYNAYTYAQLALCVITFVASAVLVCCSLCLARRRRDPARTWCTTLKVAFTLYTLSVFFVVVSDALSVAYLYVGDYYYNDVQNSLGQAAAQVAAVSDFLGNIAELTSVIIFVQLAAGISIVSDGAESKHYKWVKPTAYSISTILAILSMVNFALTVRIRVAQFANSDLGDLYISQLGLQLALQVLFFVTSILTLLLGIAVMISVRKAESRVQNAAVYLLVCTILYLLRTTYQMVTAALYANPSNPRYEVPGLYLLILVVIFVVWPDFIIYTILFALGHKKAKGLWSTEQPFMMVNPTNHHSVNNGYQQPMGFTQAAGMHQQQQQQHQQQHQQQQQHQHQQQHQQQQQPQQYHQQNASPTTMSQGSPVEVYQTQQPYQQQFQQGYQQPYQQGHQQGYRQPNPQSHEMYSPPSEHPHQQQSHQRNVPSGAVGSPAPSYAAVHEMSGQSRSSVSPGGGIPHYDQAYGLNHQADGTPPREETLPYDKK